MKHSIFYLLAAVCLLAGCNRMSDFSVTGDLESLGYPFSADSVIVDNAALAHPLIAPVTAEGFVINGKVKGAEFSSIAVMGGSRESTRYFIAEKGTVSFQKGLPCGTPLNDEILQFTQSLRSLHKEHSGEELKAALAQEFKTFISKHSNDPCAIYALLLANRRLDNETIGQLLASTSPEIRNHGEIRNLSRRQKRND